MKQIKDLQSRVKECLLDFEAKHIEDKRVDAFLKKVSKRFPKLHKRLRTLVASRRVVKWSRFKDALLKEVTLQGLPRKNVEIILNNTFNYLVHDIANPGSVPPACAKPMALTLRTALKVAVGTATSIAKITSVQAMPAPVCLAMRMKVVKGEVFSERATSLTEEREPMQSYKIEFDNTAIEAKSRKLQVGWSLEASEDAKFYHGLDIEDEIAKAVACESLHEIMAGIIQQIKDESPTIELDFSPDSIFDLPADGSIPDLREQMRKFAVAVNKASIAIAGDTRRGTANIIIASPVTVALLQSASSSVFKPATEAETVEDKHQYHLRYCGTLNRAKVYATMCFGFPEDGFIVGYRGDDVECDAGLIYAPFVPLMPSGWVVSPTTFQPTMAVFSRYEQKLFDPNYYRYLKFKE